MDTKMWENLNRLYLNNKAQAILELAVFGSILIMLLGVLVNYGMRYNFQQQVMQEAFRRALVGAAESTAGNKPTAVSYVLVKDKHIPNPANPWGLGSVVPVTSSANVIRSYKLQETADDKESLPEIIINIQDQQGNNHELHFKSAGFRVEENVDENSIDKYKEIYAETIQGFAGNDAKGNPIWLPITEEKVIKTCEQGPINPVTGVSVPVNCIIKKIRLIDPSEGQIIDYGNAVRQCRQIVDRDAFIEECEKGKEPDSDKDCSKIADYKMNVPWYCGDSKTEKVREENIVTHKYYFPILENPTTGLFAKSKEKSMGLQNSYTQTLISNNKLEKKETASAIETTDATSWQVTTKRKIIYNDALDNGVSTGVVNIKGDTDNETKENVIFKSKLQTRQTNWPSR